MTSRHTRILTFGLLCTLFCILFSSPAAAFGVSPAVLELPSAVPGAQTEAEILLSSPLTESWRVHLQSSEEWLRVTPVDPVISLGAPSRVVVTADIPPDWAPGEYEFTILFTYTPESEVVGGMSSRVAQQLRIPIKLLVTGDYRHSCVVGGVQLSPIEEGGEGMLSYSIKNLGTVRIEPVVSMLVVDMSDSWQDESINPANSRTSTHVFQTGLPPGRYPVVVAVETCEFEEELELEVLPEGSLTSEGRLAEVSLPESGGLVPLSAVFHNEGEDILEVYLEGVITDVQTGRVLRTIRGDALRVLPGQRVVLEEYVTMPAEASLVRLHAVYSGHKTEELELIHTPLTGAVVAATSKQESGRPFIDIFLFVILVGVLILIIRKKYHSS